MADSKVLHASHDGVHVLRYIGDIRYTLTPSINRFLEEQHVVSGEIDLLLLGKNGDIRMDPICKFQGRTVFQSARIRDSGLSRMMVIRIQCGSQTALQAGGFIYNNCSPV